MNEKQLEQLIKTKGLTAKRVTPSDIDGKIVKAQYWHPEKTTLTVCVLVLKNGTTVVGESACVSQENYDSAIGESVAYENARSKVWALEGYLLSEKINLEIRASIKKKYDDYPNEGSEVVQTDEQALAALLA